MKKPLVDLLSVSRQKPYIFGKEVARFDLVALFAFQRPVTENFNGNLAEVFRPSGNTTRINLLHKEL
jgi:hypothetical protein